MDCVTREMGFAWEVAIRVISMDKLGSRRGDGGRIFRQFEVPEIEAVPVGSASAESLAQSWYCDEKSQDCSMSSTISSHVLSLRAFDDIAA